MNFLLTAGGVAGALLAILALVAAVSRFAWVRDQWQRRKVEPDRAKYRDDVAAVVGPMLEPIRHELQHNDGGSLKDAVRRIEHAGEQDRLQRDERQRVTDAVFASVAEQLAKADEWRDKKDEQLAALTTDVASMHRRVLTAPAPPRPFPR